MIFPPAAAALLALAQLRWFSFSCLFISERREIDAVYIYRYRRRKKKMDEHAKWRAGAGQGGAGL